MSGGFGSGSYCGGVDCAGGHRLPPAWPEWQRRVRSGGRCADEDDGLVAEERPRLFGRRDADERARDAWRDEYEGPALDR
ncbi:hypothetical protein ACFY00_37490 [Kitasatospora sp. NPDC001540]|uniref:hypothetical protein n=1 Tax=Kitasatospora sp. NPDC001540 TaxID=3364014 RepID=UPI0036B35C5E